MAEKRNFAAGMRIVVRDAEWLVKHVGAVHHEGGRIFTVLTCVGVSNLVSGRTSKFIVEYEERPELKQKIQILDPKETRLVQDDSVNYVRTRLFIDALLRRTPATDAKIHIAQDAAMDVLAYQLEPTVWALESTRPRILIADAVGIGKTLEAGVLVSELIERQRGKRILVLAVKAMLEQFQQEFWNRFSIPLTRLDSDGIARLQQRIPASHNPFLYVDKAIISIDTLKQSALYRTYLEQAYWDIILIDEAHNVAERSSGNQRAALARLLSRRSDALIMLSATPHDGRPQSFASLIDMLDPTVIANPNDYTFDDFKDSKLVIRRFKNDIRDQAQGAFPERDIKTIKVNASLAEQAVYQNLENIEFKHIDANRKIGSVLFQTTLEKALFSSPAACISTCDNRIGKLRAAKTRVTEAGEDINTLTNFKQSLSDVDKQSFSKYQALVSLLKNDEKSLDSEFVWDKKDPEDRLVIFTESRQTLAFLAQHLPADLGLKDTQFCVLKGDDSDKDLMDKVERFNKLESPIRLMLATDVASEGLNLHRLCHRLIHFDIPWSLMTFQQRNGRIDRYGQQKKPIIRYLQTDVKTTAGKFIGDNHIMDLLIQKDKNAVANISDPGEFTGSKEDQEQQTAARIQNEAPPPAPSEEDFMSLLRAFSLGADQETTAGNAPAAPQTSHQVDRSLLFTDYQFLKTGLTLRKKLPLERGGIATEVEFDDANEFVRLAPPKDLEVRLQYLPKEVLPEHRKFELTARKDIVQRAIRDAASNPNSSWPAHQLLWELHPVMQWMEDWAIGAFGRHAAPVVHVPFLPEGEFWTLLQGGYPNKRGGTPVHDWIAVKTDASGESTVHSRKELMAIMKMPNAWTNDGLSLPVELLSEKLPGIVSLAEQHLLKRRAEYQNNIQDLLSEKLAKLNGLREKQQRLIGMEDAPMDTSSLSKRQAKTLERTEYIEKRFKEAETYTKDTYTLDDKPYVQVVALFVGKVVQQNVAEGADASQYQLL